MGAWYEGNVVEQRRASAHQEVAGRPRCLSDMARGSPCEARWASRGITHEQTASAGVRNTSADRIDNTARDKQQDTFPQRKRCPHHLHAQLVRFDPAGQAWCDKLDCWDCYRLMKIGEALDYRCLLDQGRKAVIDQGMTAWILSRSWPALNEFRTLRIRMCRSSLFISSHLKSLVLLS